MKKYPVVHVRFLDHSMGTPSESNPILCDVFGVLYHEDKLTIRIAAWVADEDLADENNETFCILKSAIVSKRRLR